MQAQETILSGSSSSLYLSLLPLAATLVPVDQPRLFFIQVSKPNFLLYALFIFYLGSYLVWTLGKAMVPQI